MSKKKDKQNSDEKLVQRVIAKDLKEQRSENKILTGQLEQSEKELELLKAKIEMIEIKTEKLREKFLPSILVVEDDPYFRQLIKSYLPEDYYYTLEVADGIEARRILFERSKEKREGRLLDLIIMDIMMPGMDGYHLCKAIKSRQEYQGIPIIMCTARNTKDDVMKAVATGADDYLIKPFSRETLLEKVKRWIRPTRKQDVTT